MNDTVEERVKQLAEYIIATKATVRTTAKKFGISKSTVHTDVSKRLLSIDKDMADKVRQVLDENKSQRHIRGGLATREKYKLLHEMANEH